MKLYIYAKSGHTMSLDAVRRCSAIANKLQKFDPLLCTCDFRAGIYAKDELGVKKAVSIDIIENLPNIMERGDILIYDSDEPNETMTKHMKDFCSLLYKVGVDISSTIIRDEFFEKGNTSIDKLFFFGDDDYNEELLKICENSSKQDIPLLMGHYFFLGNEKKLEPYFKELIDEEEYINTIKNTKYLLTGSVNTALESLASGNHPVLFQRADKKYDSLDLLTSYNIPIVTGNNLKEIIDSFNEITKNYPSTKEIQKVNINDIADSIKSLQLIKH